MTVFEFVWRCVLGGACATGVWGAATVCRLGSSGGPLLGVSGAGIHGGLLGGVAWVFMSVCVSFDVPKKVVGVLSGGIPWSCRVSEVC